MILKILKLSAFFLISLGLLSSLGIFAFNFFFKSYINENLVVLGPDIKSVFTVPQKPGGYEVSNLDIDILNNKKALIADEKLRPLPVKPELLPIETVKNNKKLNDLILIDKVNKKNKAKIDKKINSKKINIKSNNNKTDLIGMYRVQFGSFRDLSKANVAVKNMQNKYTKLLKNIKLEVFSYKNNDNLIFHRVWSFPLTKQNSLKLCNNFKLKNITCILQVNK
jgi:hypothetical protein